MAKLKTWIVLKDPFFSTILLHMKLVYTEQVPVAGTDGERLFINPKTFFGEYSEQEQRFILYHEVMHVVLETPHLMVGRDRKVMNIASDMVINYMLEEDVCKQSAGVKCPDDAVRDADLVKKYKTQIGVYDYLMQQPRKKPQPQTGSGAGGQGGKRFDEVTPAEGRTKSEREARRMQQRILTQQATQAHNMSRNARKQQGNAYANIMRGIDHTMEPKVPWGDVLRDFVVRQRDDSRSWQRMNRRFVSQGIYAPSPNGECMGPIVVAVDCSGSINDRELSAYVAEMVAIHQDMSPQAMHVLYFSGNVTHADSFGPDDEITITPRGGGGTAFSPIFRHVDGHDLEPSCAVVLTDMCCDDFGPEPEYPVLWISTTGRDHEVPFGAVVPMEP